MVIRSGTWMTFLPALRSTTMLTCLLPISTSYLLALLIVSSEQDTGEGATGFQGRNLNRPRNFWRIQSRGSGLPRYHFIVLLKPGRSGEFNHTRNAGQVADRDGSLKPCSYVSQRFAKPTS